MTTATQTLADFLLARIAEDEAVARAAAEAPWVVIPGVDASMVHVDPAVIREEKWKYGRLGHVATTSHDGDYAVHIARHDPARVLAECEAKRRIVEAFEDERGRRDIYNRDYDSGDYDFNENDLRARLASNAHCRGLEIALLGLAAAYADHPDYRDEWRV